MADGTQTRAWSIFIDELRRQGVDFSLVQHADEGVRSQVLASMTTLSVLERATVSSTWAKLAAAPASASSSPAGPGPSSGGGGRTRTSLGGGDPLAVSSYGGGGPHASFSSGIYGDRDRGMASSTPPALSLPPAPPSASSAAAAILGVPARAVVAADPTSLRVALGRADSTAALPLASELLQSDPHTLINVLHEYLPQFSVDQLRGMLGVGMSSSSQDATSGRGGTAGGADAAVNGTPMPLGHVLTAQALAGKFGPGFTASCNGHYLSLPYCLQPGDRVTVRPLNERLL